MTPPSSQATSDKPAREAARDGGLSQAIKSAKRVLELLEFFAEARRPLAVSDIVKGLGYPQSSTSVLLQSLTRLGFIDYDRQQRTYKPNIRVALLGSWVQDELFTQANLAHTVDALHAATAQTVIIGKQNDIYLQYIHLAQALDGSFPVYVKPGSLRSLCRSAMGRILLARKSDVDVLFLLRRINAEESDPERRVSASDLIRELDLIRANGYAYAEGSSTPGVGVIAVALPTPASQAPMSIGIGASGALQAERKMLFLEQLQQAIAPYASALPDRRPRQVHQIP